MEASGRAPPADRDRRRLLDGRLPRAARPDLRPGRAPRRARDGRRLARGRRRRAAADAARPSTSASSSGSTSSPGRSARRSAGRAAATSSGRREIVELLRQRARPYLFSNSLAPPVVGASLARARADRELGRAARPALREHPAHFRARMTELGFDVLPGEHPIVPVMIGDEVEAGALSPSARRARRLRGQLLVPRRPARHGADPDADVGGAHRSTTSSSRCERSSPRGTRRASNSLLQGITRRGRAAGPGRCSGGCGRARSAKRCTSSCRSRA